VSSLPYSTPPSVSPALSASTTESFSSPLPSSSSTSVVPERSADEVISTSALSVSDYFRKKMRDKMASRAAASGLTSPKLETIAMIIKDEIKLPGGAAVWRGSQTTFKQEPELPLQTGEPIFRVKQELDIRQTNDSDPSTHRYPATISTVSRPSTASSATDREAKRARKEAKRRHQNLASTSGRMVQKAVIPPSSPTEGQAQQKRKKAERPGKLNDISDQASAGTCPKKERKTAVEGLEAGHAEVRQKRKRKSLDGP